MFGFAIVAVLSVSRVHAFDLVADAQDIRPSP